MIPKQHSRADLEELQATAAFRRKQERIRQQQKIQLMGISALAVVVITALASIAIYGFIPVKDTLFRYPTKILLDGTWIKSQYGTPQLPLKLQQYYYEIGFRCSINTLQFRRSIGWIIRRIAD